MKQVQFLLLEGWDRIVHSSDLYFRRDWSPSHHPHVFLAEFHKVSPDTTDIAQLVRAVNEDRHKPDPVVAGIYDARSSPLFSLLTDTVKQAAMSRTVTSEKDRKLLAFSGTSLSYLQEALENCWASIIGYTFFVLGTQNLDELVTTLQMNIRERVADPLPQTLLDLANPPADRVVLANYRHDVFVFSKSRGDLEGIIDRVRHALTEWRFDQAE